MIPPYNESIELRVHPSETSLDLRVYSEIGRGDSVTLILPYAKRLIQQLAEAIQTMENMS